MSQQENIFLSTSLLGASRSYFFPLLTLHEISLYFTLIKQKFSLSLSLTFLEIPSIE